MLGSKLEHKCEIRTQLAELPPTYCSPGQIGQVLLNILVNAGHAIEEHGEIRIATWHTDGWIQIAIEDTGRGIPADAMSKLFDPFYTTKAVGEGTGLGLAISYGIVHEHGGEIQVTSELGKGSRFTIRLPVREPPGATAAA